MPHAASLVDERLVPERQTAAGWSPLETLVIVGNGMVGHRLCRRLVELGARDRYRVVVFGEEHDQAYDRVHLTGLFEGRDERDLQLAPSDWYAASGITLKTGAPIIAIDRHRRLVVSADGDEVEFDRLVLATGSEPHVPPLPGIDLPGVYTYRTLADLRAIRQRVRTARRAVVIGGGLLGLEAARALQRSGLSITVVESAASLMPAQLDQSGGAELGRQVTALGIHVLTATFVERIEHSGSDHVLHFAAGGSVRADIVVVATGVRPRSQLAGACGLRQSPAGGVMVDDFLQTSDPNISAIGECASHRAQVYGLVAPGYAMADVLASNLMGTRAAFRGMEPTFRLKLLEVDVTSAGRPLEGNRPGAMFRAEKTYRRLRFERGRLVGALGVGAWPEFERLADAVARRARVWPWQLIRFERTGRLWRDKPAESVTEWPPDRIVCNCLNVTRGRISAACASGAVTVASLADATGASTLCGSCRPLVAQLAGMGTAVPPAVTRTLLGVSAVAAAASVVLVLAAPVPFSATVQDTFPPDVLWRNSSVRQVTGYLLLALAVAASLLSARKRLPRLSFGTFSRWRVLHAAIGLLSIAVLAAHTGARMGSNLNFALMSSYLALNIVGAAAGGLTATAPALGARARRWRAAFVTVHILAVWPLPLLIGFHVLSVYYF